MSAVANAQAAAVAAQAEVERAKVAAAKEQLLATREEGRRVMKEMRSLLGQIRRLEAELVLLGHERLDVANALAAHIGEKPIASNFPGEKSVAQWTEELDRLKAAQLDVGRRHIDKQRDLAVPREEYLALNTALGNLRRSQENLERIVNGEKLGWQGGIRPV